MKDTVTFEKDNILGDVDNTIIDRNKESHSVEMSIAGESEREADERNDSFEKNATRNVKCFRCIVGIVLIVATLSMTLTIYYVVRNSETTNFEDMFDADANKIIHGVGESIKSNLAAMDAFASMMILIAKQTNQTFPFVTLPTFAIKASKLLTLSDGFVISTQPVVSAHQRKRWEAYTRNNQGWLNETKQIQEIDVFYHDEVNYGEETPTTILGINGTVPYDIG
jgi:hypothetical protein